MNSRQAAREITRAAIDGDVETANRLFERAIEDAETGHLKARPTIPDWAFFGILGGLALIALSGALALAA